MDPNRVLGLKPYQDRAPAGEIVAGLGLGEGGALNVRCVEEGGQNHYCAFVEKIGLTSAGREIQKGVEILAGLGQEVAVYAGAAFTGVEKMNWGNSGGKGRGGTDFKVKVRGEYFSGEAETVEVPAYELLRSIQRLAFEGVATANGKQDQGVFIPVTNEGTFGIVGLTALGGEGGRQQGWGLVVGLIGTMIDADETDLTLGKAGMLETVAGYFGISEVSKGLGGAVGKIFGRGKIDAETVLVSTIKSELKALATKNGGVEKIREVCGRMADKLASDRVVSEKIRQRKGNSLIRGSAYYRGDTDMPDYSDMLESTRQEQVLVDAKLDRLLEGLPSTGDRGSIDPETARILAQIAEARAVAIAKGEIIVESKTEAKNVGDS